MKIVEGVVKKFKEFKPTSWAIDNKTAIYIIAILITAVSYTHLTLPTNREV